MFFNNKILTEIEKNIDNLEKYVNNESNSIHPKEVMDKNRLTKLQNKFNKIINIIQNKEQENLATQKNFTSKEIQSIDSKLDIGQKLFGLADKVANLKLFSNQQLIAA